jgi:hypothetical protein
MFRALRSITDIFFKSTFWIGERAARATSAVEHSIRSSLVKNASIVVERELAHRGSIILSRILQPHWLSTLTTKWAHSRLLFLLSKLLKPHTVWLVTLFFSFIFIYLLYWLLPNRLYNTYCSKIFQAKQNNASLIEAFSGSTINLLSGILQYLIIIFSLVWLFWSSLGLFFNNPFDWSIFFSFTHFYDFANEGIRLTGQYCYHQAISLGIEVKSMIENVISLHSEGAWNNFKSAQLQVSTQSVEAIAKLADNYYFHNPFADSNSSRFMLHSISEPTLFNPSSLTEATPAFTPNNQLFHNPMVLTDTLLTAKNNEIWHSALAQYQQQSTGKFSNTSVKTLIFASLFGFFLAFTIHYFFISNSHEQHLNELKQISSQGVDFFNSVKDHGVLEGINEFFSPEVKSITPPESNITPIDIKPAATNNTSTSDEITVFPTQSTTINAKPIIHITHHNTTNFNSNNTVGNTTTTNIDQTKTLTSVDKSWKTNWNWVTNKFEENKSGLSTGFATGLGTGFATALTGNNAEIVKSGGNLLKKAVVLGANAVGVPSVITDLASNLPALATTTQAVTQLQPNMLITGKNVLKTAGSTIYNAIFKK